MYLCIAICAPSGWHSNTTVHAAKQVCQHVWWLRRSTLCVRGLQQQCARACCVGHVCCSGVLVPHHMQHGSQRVLVSVGVHTYHRPLHCHYITVGLHHCGACTKLQMLRKAGRPAMAHLPIATTSADMTTSIAGMYNCFCGWCCCVCCCMFWEWGVHPLCRRCCILTAVAPPGLCQQWLVVSSHT